MTISKKLEEQSWFPRLGRRGPNFKAMVDHVERLSQVVDQALIIETGTAHDLDNWEGQGQSTLIWDWLADQLPNLRVLSIDIRQVAVDTASGQTKNIEYICGDSIKALADFPNPQDITLLYLDSFDWSEQMNLESAAHHFFELAGVWAKLNLATMVVVDDRHGEGRGKHWMVEEYFKVLKMRPVFKNNQIGWIK